MKNTRKSIFLLLILLLLVVSVFLFFNPFTTKKTTELVKNEKQVSETKVETKKQETPKEVKKEETSKPEPKKEPSKVSQKENTNKTKKANSVEVIKNPTPSTPPTPPTPPVVKDPYTLALEAADKKIQDAQANLAIEKAKLDLAKTTKVNLEMQATKLASDLKANETARQDLEQEVLKTQKLIETLKENVVEAEKTLNQAVDSAKTNPLFLDAYNAVVAVTSKYEAALTQKQDAQNELSNATALLNTATSLKQNKEAELTNAQKQLDTVNNTIKEKEAEITRLRQEKATSEQEKQAIEERLEVLATDLDNANQQKAQRQRELDQAREAIEDSVTVLNQAREDVANAQKAIEQAQEQINKGALGFYQEHNSEVAIKILELGNKSLLQNEEKRKAEAEQQGKTIKSLGGMNIGKAGSSTSLENMKLAIDYMKKANELRANDEYNNAANKTPLKVNHAYMALAQVNTMGSKLTAINNNFNHYGGFKVIDENGHKVYTTSYGENAMAAGYDENPAIAFYQPEKEDMIRYMQENGKEITDLGKPNGIPRRHTSYKHGTIGHYLNASGTSANPNAPQKYDVMGFGVANLVDTTGIVAVNDFRLTGDRTILGTDPTPNDNRNDDEIYTQTNPSEDISVEEYEQQFMAYYNKVQKQLADAIKAKKEAETKLQELEANDGTTSEQKEAIRVATENLQAAADTVSQITSTVNNTRNELNAKKQEISNKDTSIQTTTSEKQVLEQDVIAKQQAVDIARTHLNQAIKDIQDKEVTVNQKQQLVNQKQQEIDALKVEKTEKEAKLTEVEQEVAKDITALRTNLEVVKEKLNQAKESLNALEAKKLENTKEKEMIEVNVVKNTEDLKDSEQTIEKAMEKVQKAEVKVDEAIKAKQKLINDHNKTNSSN